MRFSLRGRLSVSCNKTTSVNMLRRQCVMLLTATAVNLSALNKTESNILENPNRPDWFYVSEIYISTARLLSVLNPIFFHRRTDVCETLDEILNNVICHMLMVTVGV